MPRFSLLQIRIVAGALLALGLSLTGYCVFAERGPYPFFLSRELGEGPATHPLAAGGLTFIVTMVPVLAVILGLAAFSPLGNVFRRGAIAEARGQYRMAKAGHGPYGEQQRAARNIGIAAGGGVVGAGIRAGWFEAWFGDPGSIVASVVVALAFGLAAGIVHGRTMRGRVGFCFALGGVSVGTIPAVAWYLERRPEPLLVELALPIFVGALPGLIAFWGVAKWVERG